MNFFSPTMTPGWREWPKPSRRMTSGLPWRASQIFTRLINGRTEDMNAALRPRLFRDLQRSILLGSCAPEQGRTEISRLGRIMGGDRRGGALPSGEPSLSARRILMPGVQGIMEPMPCGPAPEYCRQMAGRAEH